MSERTCAECSIDISERHWRSKRCERCQLERERVAMSAKIRTTYIRTCGVCCSEFAATSQRQRFCSLQCGGRGGHPGNVERVCIVCDEAFSVSRQYDRETCSRVCLRWAQKNPGRKPTTHCRWCGDSLRGKMFRSEWCDDRCWHAEKSGLLWRVVRDRKCVVCEQPIPRSVHYHRVVCSSLCRTRNRSPEVLFRQQHARRKHMDAARVYRVPKTYICRLRQQHCFYCGKTGGTADHVVPISRGGKHAEGNLVPACRSCNSSKGNLLLVEWRRKKQLRPLGA